MSLEHAPLPSPWATAALGTLGAAVALTLGLLAGHLKLRLGLRTNYTRKIFHFAIFSAAMGIHAAGGFAAVNAYAVGVVAVILWGVWRGEGNIIFEGMARERDAPHRGFYVVVPLITTALGGLISNWLAGDFALVGYLVTGWGDAVGEPVGTWIGRHRFRVLSLTGIPSERSLEGCAAVFLASLLAAMAGLAALGLGASFPIALAVAVVATLLESVSPHGSDNFTTMAGAALAAQALTALLA